MGFRPVQSIGGGTYNGKVQTFGVASGHATLLAVGDLCTITGTADATGLAQVDASAAAGLITGCIVSIEPNFDNLEQAGLPAGTAGKVKLAVDRNMLMEAPSSTTVAVTDVGGNSEIVATAATLSGGLAISNMTVNTAAAISGTAQIRIEGLKDGGTAAGTILYCRINESTLDTVGV